MKLLLDEMYSPVIAEQMGGRGHDVEAVAARSELRALADEEIFDVAQQEGRTVVTENIADFSTIVNRQDTSGQSHYGLVLVNPGKHRVARHARSGAWSQNWIACSRSTLPTSQPACATGCELGR